MAASGCWANHSQKLGDDVAVAVLGLAEATEGLALDVEEVGWGELSVSQLGFEAGAEEGDGGRAVDGRPGRIGAQDGMVGNQAGQLRGQFSSRGKGVAPLGRRLAASGAADVDVVAGVAEVDYGGGCHGYEFSTSGGAKAHGGK